MPLAHTWADQEAGIGQQAEPGYKLVPNLNDLLPPMSFHLLEDSQPSKIDPHLGAT